ncbi:CaiB/BaiF CoA transferase family protein [Salinicola halophilus]|uniref:CaiB/BaiF CoA transferase family protein n=1 Tax=Salinicola halophilus TaxID=184065 RepID=UPI000DA212D3|nr:CoA transferase [Salinicola halophilus]
MQALEGMKVLDISQIMAGPYCTMVLGDMGADVVKVEKTQGGDDSRQMGPYVNDESTCFAQINRNKRSISLNLKEADGLEIFYQLAREADVVVENYRPGVTQSLKIDYETLKAINPGLVYCSISGYGQTGPYRTKGGFDLVAQGMTGLMSMTGEAGGRPLKTGIAVYDIGAGLTAIYSILAAYIHKQKTGEGQFVDVAIAECGLPWFTWEAAAYFAEGRVPQPTGWRHRVSAPYQALKTRDGYLMLGCANQRTWERLCNDVLGRPELIADPRFATNSDRGHHVEALESLLESLFVEEDMSHWLRLCDAAGVPAGPINDFADAMEDPHYREREMIQTLDHPVIGRMQTLGFASKLSQTPPRIRRPAPTFAQHTQEVLATLGVDDARLAALRERGVVR